MRVREAVGPRLSFACGLLAASLCFRPVAFGCFWVLRRTERQSASTYGDFASGQEDLA